MFENLSERLERSFKILKGEGKITEINVAETLKDVRIDLRSAMACISGMPPVVCGAGSVSAWIVRHAKAAIGAKINRLIVIIVFCD